jgi:hypothetical protein
VGSLPRLPAMPSKAIAVMASGGDHSDCVPSRIALDGSGNVHRDSNNQRIRKVTSAGIISTLQVMETQVCGDGGAGHCRSAVEITGSPSTQTVLSSSRGHNSRVRRLTDGIIVTVGQRILLERHRRWWPGDRNQPDGHHDASGSLLITDLSNYRITKWGRRDHHHRCGYWILWLQRGWGLGSGCSTRDLAGRPRCQCQSVHRG